MLKNKSVISFIRRLVPRTRKQQTTVGNWWKWKDVKNLFLVRLHTRRIHQIDCDAKFKLVVCARRIRRTDIYEKKSFSFSFSLSRFVWIFRAAINMPNRWNHFSVAWNKCLFDVRCACTIRTHTHTQAEADTHDIRCDDILQHIPRINIIIQENRIFFSFETSVSLRSSFANQRRTRERKKIEKKIARWRKTCECSMCERFCV